MVDFRCWLCRGEACSLSCPACLVFPLCQANLRDPLHSSLLQFYYAPLQPLQGGLFPHMSHFVYALVIKKLLELRILLGFCCIHRLLCQSSQVRRLSFMSTVVKLPIFFLQILWSHLRLRTDLPRSWTLLYRRVWSVHIYRGRLYLSVTDSFNLQVISRSTFYSVICVPKELAKERFPVPMETPCKSAEWNT